MTLTSFLEQTLLPQNGLFGRTLVALTGLLDQRLLPQMCLPG